MRKTDSYKGEIKLRHILYSVSSHPHFTDLASAHDQFINQN
jgi:hypothetical protein